MVADFDQNLFGAIGIGDEKPVVAELIIDRKLMPAIIEIEPHFDDAVRDEFGDLRAVQLFRVVGKIVKENGFGHIGKMARTVVHPHVE